MPVDFDDFGLQTLLSDRWLVRAMCGQRIRCYCTLRSRPKTERDTSANPSTKQERSYHDQTCPPLHFGGWTDHKLDIESDHFTRLIRILSSSNLSVIRRGWTGDDGSTPCVRSVHGTRSPTFCMGTACTGRCAAFCKKLRFFSENVLQQRDKAQRALSRCRKNM